jgi:hypothetical protein
VPIDPETLSSLASAYAKDMTSIRGRRVQRLLMREFGGADCVLPARLGAGTPAVLGLSAHGAALCATDGTGKQATVFKWLHGAAEALESQFDLHKDSLPLLGSAPIPMARLRERVGGCAADRADRAGREMSVAIMAAKVTGDSMDKLFKAAAVASMVVAMGCAHAAASAPAGSGTSSEGGVVGKVEHAVAKGAHAAASGVERGAKAAARGVERGAKATARVGHRVAAKVTGSPASSPASAK